MKRVISLILALSLLCSSGLFDIIAWAAEELPEGSQNVSQDSTQSMTPVFQFDPIIQEEGARILAVDESTGLEYERLNNTYCEITGYEGNESRLVIPEKLGGYTVRSIGESAFSWNGDLEQVTLPDTVERICDYAFDNCHNLEQINIPDCVEEIGERAFTGCERLRSFTIPSSLKRSGSAVWEGCADLETIGIPEDLTVIPCELFMGSCIRSITIPDSVEKIEEGAFRNCQELTEITIPDSVTEIGPYAFENCANLEQVQLPEEMELLSEGIFAWCGNLRSITLPEALTEIGAYVFEGCGRLENIQLPDSITFLGERAFADCIRLSQINYPVSLETVEGGVFAGCTELETIEIPEGVTALPDHLFEYCDSLKTVVLPSTLETIGIYVFNYCTKLEEVTLPEGLTEIGEGAFAECDSLESIEIPGSITILSPFLLAGCDRLVDVTLPDGLERIESNVFEACRDLESIVLPDSVEYLGGYCFAHCERLSQINYPLSLNESEGCVFVGCRDLETITVPEGVTALPESIFSDCDGLETILLPSTLTAIGPYAFVNCYDLQHITLPENLTELGYNAFENCDSLREIVIPGGISVLPEGLFYDCDRLTSVTLPEGMTELGYYCFENCRTLASILLPDSLEIIGSSAFSGCEKLSAILLPEGLYRIDDSAFSSCVNLTEITIPDSVTEIGWDVFWGIEDLAIRCHLNSHAAAYAIENGITIAELTGEIADDLYELDTANSSYQINYDGLSATGSLSLVLRYRFKDRSWAEPHTLTISIPSSSLLLENTLTLDGEFCEDYEYYPDEEILYIYVTETEGIVRFSLKPLSYEKITSFAKIEFVDENDQYRTEVVGVVYAEMPIITLSAKEETSEKQVTVSGVTMPGNTVTFTINGEEAGSCTANSVGNYTAELPLTDTSDGKHYTIQAQTTDADGNVLSAETLVIYRSGTPTLTDFVMYHAGQTYRMEDLQGIRPVVTFVPNEVFRFEVFFDQHESIESLFIVSTRSNQRKMLEAHWDEELGAYVAEGFFDPQDESYVPGTITIEYVRKGEKVSFLTGYDFTSDESVNAVPDDWKDAEVTVNENTEDRTDVTITKPDGSVSVQVITDTVVIPQYITQNNYQEYGFVLVYDDYGNPAWVRYHEDNGAPQIDVLDWTHDVMHSQVMEIIGDAVGVPGEVFTALDLISTLGETISHDMEFQRARNEIINSNMTSSQKAAALAQLDNAQNLNAMLGVTRMAGTLAAAAIGASMGPAGIVVAVAWGLLDHYLGYLQESNLYYMGSKSLWELIFGWVIDPSGYVYDKQSGKRLSGVTVTAYWIPYDDSVVNFWDAVPDDGEYGEFWDAEAYSQMNPLITDEEGRYAWDVPEGWWRVEYELDGYESTWSHWMPVPPPQTEVNVGLTATDEDHEHDYTPQIVEPTCTEEGYTLYTCACGDSYEDDYVEALDHDFCEWYVITEATEDAEGEEQRDCSRCGESETRVIPVIDHVHDYTAEITDPTCTEGGYTTYTCDCGDSYEDDYTDALGHEMGQWMESKAPGCTTEGEEIRGCDRCDYTETQTIEPTGHSHTPVVTEATCTEGGYTTYYCACGDSYVDDYTDALGHEMGQWMESKAPGCTTEGEEIRGCDRCDYTETQTIEPTGHSWSDWQVVREATETTEGEERRVCVNCGMTESRVIPKLDHVHDYTSVVTDPTCTEEGFTTYTCSCGHSYVDDYTDALGHSFGAWYVITEATEDAAGEEQRDCSRCDAFETREIPKLDHVHGYIPIVTPPTCTEAGYTTYTCNCGHSYVDDYVSATGHSYSVTITEPTCTDSGFTTHTCSSCGDSYVDSYTSALGHDFQDGSCTRCGESDGSEIVNPFEDVDQTQWYFAPVLWAVEEKITSGTSATTFAPNATCTRAQVVTFLWRAMGSPEPESEENPFSDVMETDYFYSAVLWAVEQGITSGTGNGQFSPNRPCTRDQVVTFLWRTMGQPEPEKTDNPFTDVTEGIYYYQPVLWAVENNITSGTSATTFAPSNPCTRAQVVTFLFRTLKDQ
ncbi:MAG: leucine-rich repeat protein [Oscillospiraceae bacterium]|nr:leucine-rich repeat protein [Oscillospiraceae bacterium]